MDTWKLQDAKARFSEVVDRAMADGPQVITRHGHGVAVVISYEKFKETAPSDFKTFLLSWKGLLDEPLTVERQKSREIDFE